MADEKKEEKKKVTMVDIADAVERLTGEVTRLIEKYESDNKKPSEPTAPTPPVPPHPSITAASQFPVPLEYRELVDTILNKHFGIDIKYLSDSASFEFSVLVPEKYSNAGKTHWETYHEDRRSKVLLNAYGANGVRDYVTQVYNNFPDETKSAITYERAQI